MIQVRLKGIVTAPKAAYWYWLFENLKYGISLFFFSSVPYLNVILTGIGSVGLFLLVASMTIRHFRNTGKAFIVPKEIKLLGIFYVMAGISLFWSSQPGFAFPLWANLLVDAVTFLLICQFGQVEQIVHKALHGFIHGALITTTIALVLNPLESIELHRIGQFGLLDAVRFGNILALASLFLTYYLLHSKNWKQRCVILLQLAFILYGFISTVYKVGTLALLSSLFVLVLLYPNPARLKRQFMAVVAMMAMLVLGGSYQRLLSYADLLGGQMLSTLSGRTIIWEASWEMIQENLLWGYGAGNALSTERLAMVNANFGTIVRQTQAHNEWLNMWLQYGLPGLGFAIGIYALFFFRIRAFQKNNKEAAALCLALFAYYMIRTPFESVLVGLLIPETLMIMLIFWCRQTVSGKVREDRRFTQFSAVQGKMA